MPRRVDHLSKVTRSADAYARARDARDETIRAAVAAGHSMRSVAEAAGISHTEVRRILARA
jgi:hypothetical protein